jgi:serine/threonine protein phosphatase PrpC
MGTTVTAVRVSDDCAVFANAGDSRLYVFSGGSRAADQGRFVGGRGAGALLLLCSDGLHGVVPDALIAETLAGQRDAAAMADRLVQVAIERGTRDNITAVVVCFAD